MSFGSSIVLATQLGASTRTDAYYLALSVPVVVFAVLLAGIRLGGIPALTRLSQEDSPASFDRSCSELIAAAVVAATILSILITGVMLVVLPAAAGGSLRLAALTRVFLAELAPYAVSGAVLGTLGAILAVRGRFAIVTAVLAIEPVLKSVLLLLWRKELGVQALILGNLVGNFLAIAVLWKAVAREGIALHVSAFRQSPVVRSVARLSAPLILSQAVLQLNPLIDRTTAAGLGRGSVTELEFGLRLFTAPTALLMGMMVAPLAAGWSARLVNSGWAAVQQSFTRLVAALMVLVPPIIVLGVAFRHELVAFAYGSHRYTPIAVTRTANVLGALLIGLMAQIVAVPLATLFVIRGDTVFPLKIGIANCILNASLDLAFRGSLGVAGIALSTTVTYTVLSATYAAEARRRWGGFQVGGLLRRLGPLSLAAAGGVAGASWLVHNLFGGGGSRWEDLATICIGTAAAVVVHGTIITLGRGWSYAGLQPPLRWARTRLRMRLDTLGPR